MLFIVWANVKHLTCGNIENTRMKYTTPPMTSNRQFFFRNFSMFPKAIYKKEATSNNISLSDDIHFQHIVRFLRERTSIVITLAAAYQHILFWTTGQHSKFIVSIPPEIPLWKDMHSFFHIHHPHILWNLQRHGWDGGRRRQIHSQLNALLPCQYPTLMNGACNCGDRQQGEACNDPSGDP